MRIAYFILVLRELLHEVQFQVCNGKEYYCHAGKSQVVLPQAPATHINALIFQILISCAPPMDKYTHIYKLSRFEISRKL